MLTLTLNPTPTLTLILTPATNPNPNSPTPTTNPNPTPNQVWGCAVQSGHLKLLRDAPRALVYLLPLYWAEVRVRVRGWG